MKPDCIQDPPPTGYLLPQQITPLHTYGSSNCIYFVPGHPTVPIVVPQKSQSSGVLSSLGIKLVKWHWVTDYHNQPPSLSAWSILGS